MKQLDGTGLKRLHRSWRQRTTRRIALVLDNVGTPVNVGAIVRSAAAFGVEHLWCAGASAPPTAPGAAKVALGTDRYVAWSATDTVDEAIAISRAEGFFVIGLELADESAPLHGRAWPGAVCLVVGHEDHGLSKGAIAACDAVAYVPLIGRVGSINVATATAIALYELRRAEWETS